MRPSPVVNLGPVDASCALVVCDIHQPDHPIIYANEPFVQLTGYTLREMLGKNCRFMQAPDGNVARASKRAGVVDVHTLRRLRDAVAANRELAVEVTNFKKGGQTFTNLLTIIPIAWGSAPAPRYYVGFIAEKP
ncbi:PAS domain-containing protein [Xylaria sp. CBS 124048]|nr:PAS domain-containing protein [Xylaria sp. CBS 124048]